MAKVGAPKKKKAKPKLSDNEQSERLKDTARKLGVDDARREKFERHSTKLSD